MVLKITFLFDHSTWSNFDDFFQFCTRSNSFHAQTNCETRFVLWLISSHSKMLNFIFHVLGAKLSEKHNLSKIADIHRSTSTWKYGTVWRISGLIYELKKQGIENRIFGPRSSGSLFCRISRISVDVRF